MGEEAQVTLNKIDGKDGSHDDGNDGSHDDGGDDDYDFN